MSKLASVVLVTRNRRLFARRALMYYRRQLYEPRELVIVDNSDSPDPFFTNGADCTVVRLEGNHYIGALRNAGVAAARGEFIVFLDDDDWYSPGYVSRNIRTLEQSDAVISGMLDSYWYDVTTRHGYKRTDWGRHPGCLSMASRRSYLTEHPFPSRPGIAGLAGEDSILCEDAELRGDLVLGITEPQWMVYIRHPKNMTGDRRQSASMVDHTEAVRALIGPYDLDFYDGLSELLPSPGEQNPRSHLPMAWR